MSNLISRETPSFTNLQLLTYLDVRLLGTVTHTFDKTIVSGLSNLLVIYFRDSYFNGITEGAFDNMIELKYLYFASNKIKYIEDGVFTNLSCLRSLILSNNGIETVSENVFEGLTELTNLELNQNPLIPIKALLQTRSLIDLSIIC